ncbi:ABC transporter substrate-binding protein [Prauserella marina]|uniref:Ribose transport system substrate-binding protein n=1 Tax=Prauserella marina TaxID=530584 RepID=A0A222VNX6_9PSEU|nr:substrate-binding domain-containing protein [Prauserella marina]ASR35625.1 ABC transporter substrate-binding protein [Prauserella marina]PWV84511.1 ribose transport system substrate-binding protein [Prauserella marina]SDC20553.1 ribose transport system substrate-binding protein [Prauserella marina]
MKRACTVVLAASALVLAACSSDLPTEPGAAQSQAQGESSAQSQFFDKAEYDRQLALRDATPTGPEDRPWEQALEPEMVDTSQYKKDGPYQVCFSNASVDNPWRQVGFKTMQAEADLHDDIAQFTVLDAEAKDDKQISDMASLVSQGCDALIVSPNTTATLTPAVEAACDSGIPVVVFDRGVNTECPVTFIHPIGGYAFGASAAEFLSDEVGEGGKVLGLRVLPGVDVLEHRWAAADRVFDERGVQVVGAEFTENDSATAKSIVSDYLQREGQIDGIWMDDGTAAVAVLEAFEDAGMEPPAISGEDQQQFLQKWKDEGLTALAPTYPTYQWRTPVIAALKILRGEEVPKEWILPQPVIDSSTLDNYLTAGMPPLHYGLCGCQEMPGYPQRWQ